MDKYILGVDGGGTKTHCALYKESGEAVDMITWGTTNHEVLDNGFTDLKRELNKMLNFILEKNGITKEQIKNAVFGLCGVDTLNQYRTISHIIEDLGIKPFTLCNDAYLGIKAGSDNGIGICAINGTGCNVVGVDQMGNMLQIGGVGRITGDKGGGLYISQEASGAIYNSLFREGKPTLLTIIVFNLLGITTKYEYVEVLTEKIETGAFKLIDLTPIVFEAANKKDEVSIRILEKMGYEYARSIGGMIKHLDFNKKEELSIVLAGSVFVKGNCPVLIDTLKEKIINDHKDRHFKFIILSDPPVMGAVKWALEDHSK